MNIYGGIYWLAGCVTKASDNIKIKLLSLTVHDLESQLAKSIKKRRRDLKIKKEELGRARSENTSQLAALKKEHADELACLRETQRKEIHSLSLIHI